MKRYTRYRDFAKVDELEFSIKEMQASSVALLQAQEALKQAQEQVQASKLDLEDKRAKVIYLLKHSNQSFVIVNRVKYSLVNDELHKELVLD